MRTITDLKGTFTLHNGVQMPYFGLGVYQADNDKEVEQAIEWALETGYRHVDTASIYKNEEGVGRAIKNTSISREDIFVVSKVWNSDQGYESTIKAFHQSLSKLQLEYLDLYLVHWPVEGLYKETWRALEHLYEEGLVKAIGVSNFLKHHLEDLISDCKVIPMVNQMEFHPHLVQQELLDFCNAKSIQYEAWSPMMQGKIFGMQEFDKLKKKYDKTASQIVLRWNLQKGVVTIPKSVKKEHIVSNADIFDFELSEEDISFLDNLDQNKRIGPDPDNFDF
ncbi:MAG: aldo/keto reductase [Aquimarina sp.]|nr:aldo/keto reductase [Aquimarina sp.]